MTYIKHLFSPHEKIYIKKYFPSVEYQDQKTYEVFHLPIRDDQFQRKFHRMMTAMQGDGRYDFYVRDDGFQRFLSSGQEGSRNVWEYYLYLTKEWSK